MSADAGCCGSSAAQAPRQHRLHITVPISDQIDDDLTPFDMNRSRITRYGYGLFQYHYEPSIVVAAIGLAKIAKEVATRLH